MQEFFNESGSLMLKIGRRLRGADIFPESSGDDSSYLPSPEEVPRGLTKKQKEAKAEEVEKTAPGSRNDWRITYSTGSQKWTDDRPGDGENDEKEKEIDRLLNNDAVQEALQMLEDAINALLSGNGSPEDLMKAVAMLIGEIGEDKARLLINSIYKEETKQLKAMETKDASEEEIGVQKEIVEALKTVKGSLKSASCREANVKDVLNKIVRKIRDDELAKSLINKVVEYYKTKDESKDLSLSDSSKIYRDVDYGDDVSLSKRKKLDIDWSNHAEYRSDLRDVNPEMVNRLVTERLRTKLPKPDRKKVKFKEPGLGTMVVDYDMTKNPADAKVVTVWG